jgi:hypothetical protein
MDYFFGALTFGLPGTGVNTCGLNGIVNDVLQSTGTASSTSTFSGAPAQFNSGTDSYSGTGTANAQYGTVGAKASGAVVGDSAGGTAESVGYGIASDTLSFGPRGAGNGATGFVVLDYTINGSLSMSSSAAGEAAAKVTVQVGTYSPQTVFYSMDSSLGISLEGYSVATGLSSGVPGCVSGTALSGTVSFSCTNGTVSTQMMPVAFNTPTAVDLALFVGADPSYGGSIDPGVGISLSGITLYNAEEQEISSFTITSGSGAQYGADGIESQPASNTPEPATFWLAACALAALAWTRRVRRQRA